MYDATNNAWLVVNGIASWAIVPSIYVFWYRKHTALPYAWVLWLFMVHFASTGAMSLLKIGQPQTVEDLVWLTALIRVALMVSIPLAVQKITQWPGPVAMRRACKELAIEVGRLSEKGA